MATDEWDYNDEMPLAKRRAQSEPHADIPPFGIIPDRQHFGAFLATWSIIGQGNQPTIDQSAARFQAAYPPDFADWPVLAVHQGVWWAGLIGGRDFRI